MQFKITKKSPNLDLICHTIRLVRFNVKTSWNYITVDKKTKSVKTRMGPCLTRKLDKKLSLKCFESPADNILQPTRMDTHQTMATVVAK